MSSLRALACLVLLSFMGSLVAAQSTKTMRETVALSASGTVAIDTYKGSIAVTTWERNEVEIDVRIAADEDADLVELTDVQIDATNGRVQITTDYDRARKASKKSIFGVSWTNVSLPFVHYTIKMPRTARLTIDDYKSEIRVDDVRANVNVETYKGTFDARGIVGHLGIDTYKGTARVSGLKGSVDVDTYKGDIEIAFDALEGDCRADTYKGSIALAIPQGAGFRLDADLDRRGDLDSDFNLSSLRIARERDTEYRGSVNGGGPLVALETSRGTYALRAR